MGDEIRVVQGRVILTGELTPEVIRTLTTRHRQRTEVEIWRARIRSTEFLAELPQLTRLSIVNSSLDHPAQLAQLVSLRALFLNQGKPAGGWDFLAQLRQLHELDLLNIRGAVTLPSLAGLPALSRVRLWGCAGITELTPVAAAPSLVDVEVVGAPLTPDDFLPLLTHPQVRRVHAQLGSAKANAALDVLLTAAGKVRHLDG